MRRIRGLAAIIIAAIAFAAPVLAVNSSIWLFIISMFVSQLLLLALAALSPILGTAIAARAASINTTISSSTSVKPLFALIIFSFLSK